MKYIADMTYDHNLYTSGKDLRDYQFGTCQLSCLWDGMHSSGNGGNTDNLVGTECRNTGSNTR